MHNLGMSLYPMSIDDTHRMGAVSNLYLQTESQSLLFRRLSNLKPRLDKDLVDIE